MPENLEKFVEQAGYRILDRQFFPATNQTLDSVRRKQFTISCAFISERA
jgi:hypothetical protein